MVQVLAGETEEPRDSVWCEFISQGKHVDPGLSRAALLTFWAGEFFTVGRYAVKVEGLAPSLPLMNRC